MFCLPHGHPVRSRAACIDIDCCWHRHSEILLDRYRKQGYSYCYVTQVDGMETGNLKVKLLEGRVGKVSITQVNSEGKPTGKIGNIPEHVILREIPFAVSLLPNSILCGPSNSSATHSCR